MRIHFSVVTPDQRRDGSFMLGATQRPKALAGGRSCAWSPRSAERTVVTKTRKTADVLTVISRVIVWPRARRVDV